MDWSLNQSKKKLTIALQTLSSSHHSGNQGRIAGIPDNQSATTHWVVWWDECVIQLESLATGTIIPYVQLQLCSRLFHKGIAKQLIMHVTGHRSTTGVMQKLQTHLWRSETASFSFPGDWAKMIRNCMSKQFPARVCMWADDYNYLSVHSTPTVQFQWLHH